MESSEFCPRPLTRQDAAALIGILAVLEGEMSAGNVDEQAVDHFRRRLIDDGLVSGAPGDEDVPATLGELNQRVRFALGEYD
jgi:hypothetical protein